MTNSDEVEIDAPYFAQTSDPRHSLVQHGYAAFVRDESGTEIKKDDIPQIKIKAYMAVNVKTLRINAYEHDKPDLPEGSGQCVIKNVTALQLEEALNAGGGLEEILQSPISHCSFDKPVLLAPAARTSGEIYDAHTYSFNDVVQLRNHSGRADYKDPFTRKRLNYKDICIRDCVTSIVSCAVAGKEMDMEWLQGSSDLPEPTYEDNVVGKFAAAAVKTAQTVFSR